MEMFSSPLWAAGSAVILLSALCWVLVPALAHAASLSEQEVQAAVQTWVRLVTAQARPDATVERMEPYEVDGETVAYIAHLSGGGFCLTGADRMLLPVYFYDPCGTYDPANPEYQCMLTEIGARLEACRKAQSESPGKASLQAALSERATYWQSLVAGAMPDGLSGPAAPAGAPSSLLLPMTSHWKQDPPYNEMCPGLPTSPPQHALIGCNATATAQIMYYWKWPNTGLGSGERVYVYYHQPSGYWDVEHLDPSHAPSIPGGWFDRLRYDPVDSLLMMSGYWDYTVYMSAFVLMSDFDYQTALFALFARMPTDTIHAIADFGAATYNWALMQDVHQAPYDAGDFDMALLNSHVAIACQTEFGVNGSYADFNKDSQALREHFRYDPDALFTATANGAALVEDLQWGRVVGLGGGQSGCGGHAWVVDGYNTGVSPWQFHMNMGWGPNGQGPCGFQDGWWTMEPPGPFSDAHDMMTRIAPVNVRFVGGDGPGDGSPDSPYQNLGVAAENASAGDILFFKAGSENFFNGTISKPLTLKGYGATIR